VGAVTTDLEVFICEKPKWALQDSNKKSQLTTNKELSKTAKNDKVHDPVQNTIFCPELQQVIDHWDSLPEHIKAAIKALAGLTDRQKG
jgi:hypothetical protein